MLTRLDIVMFLLLAGLGGVSSLVNFNSQSPHITDGNHLMKVNTAASDTSFALLTKQHAALPDFTQIADVRTKKQRFFNFMLPMVEENNARITTIREGVKLLANQEQLTNDNKQWLTGLAVEYKVPVPDVHDEGFFTRLLSHIDIVPPSLALAQAANESAWGTSRFAREGNNLFGQWCFVKGCGLVPSGRPAGATYEVRVFPSVFDSVKAYMFNLNTHRGYQRFRAIRAKLRTEGEVLLGAVLAEGLQAYSIRGVDYVDELVAMIASNNLVDYDMAESPIQ